VEDRYLVGLVGTGIATSLSPALHEREADRLGLRYLYQLIDVASGPDGVGAVLAAARRLGFRGLNVTHPYKRAVLRYLDELSPEAAAVEAVNTVVFDGGRAIGHNTDVFGFERSFRRGLAGVATGLVVLLGAGGAGAAVATAMLGLGAARVVVVDPDGDRARRLVESAAARFGRNRVAIGRPDRLGEHLERADGLVNASPVGMTGHPGTPVAPGLLADRVWVADIVYRPLRTRLLAEAARHGCRTLDGGGMAVFQAVRAFEVFTGRAPDADRMLAHLAELTAHA
jgi:quinate/shikimate dehydrogenase (NAD+)